MSTQANHDAILTGGLPTTCRYCGTPGDLVTHLGGRYHKPCLLTVMTINRIDQLGDLADALTGGEVPDELVPAVAAALARAQTALAERLRRKSESPATCRRGHCCRNASSGSACGSCPTR